MFYVIPIRAREVFRDKDAAVAAAHAAAKSSGNPMHVVEVVTIVDVDATVKTAGRVPNESDLPPLPEPVVNEIPDD